MIPDPTPGIAPAATPRPRFGAAIRLVWANRKARVGLIILAVFVLVAIFAPLIAPFDPTASDFARRAAPSGDHWLGTTAAGEDALSQLVYGARVSILVGLAAGGLTTLIAIVVGLIWGYLRNAVGDGIGFVVNLVLVIPGLPLMIVIAAYLQNGGLPVILLVIVITGWAWGARVLRAQTQSLRSRDFVMAAQFSGDGFLRIVFREILPNMTSLIVSNFVAAAVAAVIAESGLSFLGLGDSRTVSWGTMLYWAQNSAVVLTGQWLLILLPGLCIALLAVSLLLINFGIDGISNPRLREGKNR